MQISQRVQKLLEEKLAKQIEVEIKHLQSELDGGSLPFLKRIFVAPLKWIASNLAVITVGAAIATLYLGILSYEKETEGKRETRFYSLVEILQQHAPYNDKSNQDIATAAIGAMRSGFSQDKKYAFLVAFSIMPHAVLKDASADPVRRIASETLADAIYMIDDYPEFQTIFSKWHDVIDATVDEINAQQTATPEVSAEFPEDSQRVVCALGRTIQRFGFSGPQDMSSCPERD